MIIEKAVTKNDWIQASQILTSVVERLNRLEKPLWTTHQVSIEGLKSSYQLHELHFLKDDALLGVVFLQKSDPYFWPEKIESNSLYIHKLAILPERSGEQLGKRAIRAILEKARLAGIKWLRLDCDDRPELHRFYQDSGFNLVDIKQMEEFRVSRYQLLTNTGCGREKHAPQL